MEKPLRKNVKRVMTSADSIPMDEAAEIKKLEYYRRIVIHEFYPESDYKYDIKIGRACIPVCQKAVSDFERLNPSPESLADLMLTVVEQACQFTDDYGDIGDDFYDDAEESFETAMMHLCKYNLIDYFLDRIGRILESAASCGYGFPDELNRIFEEAQARARALRK